MASCIGEKPEDRQVSKTRRDKACALRASSHSDVRRNLHSPGGKRHSLFHSVDHLSFDTMTTFRPILQRARSQAGLSFLKTMRHGSRTHLAVMDRFFFFERVNLVCAFTTVQWKSLMRLFTPKVISGSSCSALFARFSRNVERLRPTVRLRERTGTKSPTCSHTELQTNAPHWETPCFTPNLKHPHPDLNIQALLGKPIDFFGTRARASGQLLARSVPRDKVKQNDRYEELPISTLPSRCRRTSQRGKRWRSRTPSSAVWRLLQQRETFCSKITMPSHSEKKCGNSESNRLLVENTCGNSARAFRLCVMFGNAMREATRMFPVGGQIIGYMAEQPHREE